MILVECGKKVVLLVQNSYCFADQLFCSLRLLRRYIHSISTPDDTLLENFLNNWHRFFTQEMKNTHVRIHFQEETYDYYTDSEGWAHLRLPIRLSGSDSFSLKILIPCYRKSIQVSVTPLDFTHNNIIVISDIDDTIIESTVHRPLKMYKSVIFGNIYTRNPVQDMDRLYGYLEQKGARFIYISKTPVNLYDHILEFLKIHHLPQGLIFLRQFGVTKICDAPLRRNRNFKKQRIEALQFLLQGRKVLFFGDTGEKDLEVYSALSHSLKLDSLILIRITKPIAVPRNINGNSDNMSFPRLVYFKQALEVIPAIEDFLAGNNR